MILIDADKLKDIISDTWVLDRIDEQIKYGWWISTDEMIGYRCSVCGKGSDEKSSYCSNCGAQMIDEVNEQ